MTSNHWNYVVLRLLIFSCCATYFNCTTPDDPSDTPINDDVLTSLNPHVHQSLLIKKWRETVGLKYDTNDAANDGPQDSTRLNASLNCSAGESQQCPSRPNPMESHPHPATGTIEPAHSATSPDPSAASNLVQRPLHQQSIQSHTFHRLPFR